MFVSEYLNTDLDGTGVFDALLDKDSHFFINVIRLKKSTIPEFVGAYQHMNQYFSDIATLLDAADMPDMKDKMYREARNRFHFHEVNGINLGFAESRWGAGWGDVTSDQVLWPGPEIADNRKVWYSSTDTEGGRREWDAGVSSVARRRSRR